MKHLSHYHGNFTSLESVAQENYGFITN